MVGACVGGQDKEAGDASLGARLQYVAGMDDPVGADLQGQFLAVSGILASVAFQGTLGAA